MGGVEVAKKITLRKYFNFELPLKVSDVFGFDCKFIFILESPEMDEVQTGHPACGSSGRSMSKIILPIINEKKYDKFGFGFLISKLPYKLKSFGVMNVCNYPLQFFKEANYVKDNLKTVQKLKRFLDNKAEVQQNGTYKDINTDLCYDLVSLIRKDFEKRINNIGYSKDVIFIPCGDFARTFFEYYCRDMSDLIKEKIYPDWVRRIPHPSFNQWGSKNVLELIVELNELKDKKAIENKKKTVNEKQEAIKKQEKAIANREPIDEMIKEIKQELSK